MIAAAGSSAQDIGEWRRVPAWELHQEGWGGPELNQDDSVWNLLKRGDLQNRCCHDHDELRWEVRLAVRRLQPRPHLLTACFRQCGYVQ